MDRILIYMLAISDILLGFLIYYRGMGRFGIMNYKTFLDQEERLEEKKTD